MAYGTVKVDNITFDNGGSDQNVTVESIYIAQTSGITVTGTVQAPSIVGTTNISGVYITGEGALFTGAVTVSGTLAASGLSSEGADVYTNNGAFITADADGPFSPRAGTNIDHIWHDDTANAWHFVSDGTYKATGNSELVFGDLDINGRVDGNLMPLTDNTGLVGDATYTWSNGQFTNLTIDSTLNVRAAIDLADSDILRFGSSDDWELFHDGTNNYCDLNVGNLLIRDNTTTRFTFSRTSGTFTATGSIDAGTQFLGQGADTAALPSFSWTGDNDTGFYRTNTNEIGVTTGGTSSARFTGNDFEVVNDVRAGLVNGVYSSGENGQITAYARNSSWQTAATWTAYAQVVPRYTIDDVAVFQHVSRTASGDTASSRVYSSIKATGRALFYENVYAGLTQSSTTSTPTNYYKSGIQSVTAYGRNSSTHASESDWSTICGMVADYRNGINTTLEDVACFYYRTRTGNNVETWLQNLSVDGRAWHYHSAYTGRCRSSTTGTPTDYYRSGEHGLFAYAGASTSDSYVHARNVADTSPVFYARVANAAKFYVEADGSIHAVSTTISAISDERLKSEIVDATSQWEDVKRFRWRKFRYNQEIEAKGDAAKVHLGVVAQELAEISPGLVETKYERDENGKETDVFSHYEVNYAALWMKSCVALQEAMKRIETLEARVASLEAV